MRIEVHFESGGFWALKPEWNELLHRSCCDTLFLTWEWQSTWWKHLGDGNLLLLGLRGGDDGRLVGIAPLYHAETDEGQSVIHQVGCRDVSDYLDLIVEVGQEDAVYRAVLDYLENEAPAWDIVDWVDDYNDGAMHRGRGPHEGRPISSLHPGGAQCVYADGAVHFVPDTVDSGLTQTSSTNITAVSVWAATGTKFGKEPNVYTGD